MTSVGAILAMDPSGVIGCNGALPWHHPEDLRRFKEATRGSILVVGATTYAGLPLPLPDRRFIVVSRTPSMKMWGHQPLATVTSLQTAVLRAQAYGCPVWIAGGGEIFRKAFGDGIVRHALVTVVPPVDPLPKGRITKFPKHLLSPFALVSEETGPGGLVFRRYERNR